MAFTGQKVKSSKVLTPKQEYEELRVQFNIPEEISVFNIWNLQSKKAIPAIRLQGHNKVKLIEIFPNEKAFNERVVDYQIYRDWYKNALCEFSTLSETLHSYNTEFLSYTPFDKA